MGDWQFPQHYTPQAKRFKVSEMSLQTQHFADQALPDLRKRATALGYTLALHGSIQRDLDLIAVPWRDDACAPEHLIKALAEETKIITGWGMWQKDIEQKPHGRIATIIIATAEVQIDLSIMPRAPGDQS